MPPKGSSPLKPETKNFRRQPRQVRAEQTVERIMQATLQLILENGYSKVTTNRIARKAGVNISSLYQYFQSKQAIVLAIYEKAAAEYTSKINQTIMSQMPSPIAIGMPRIVGDAMKFVSSRRAIFLTLVNEVPELRQSTAQISLEKLSLDISYLYIKQHLRGVDEPTIRLRVFCCQYGSLSLINRFLLDRPAGVSQKRFVEELSQICIGMLEGNQRRPSSRRKSCG